MFFEFLVAFAVSITVTGILYLNSLFSYWKKRNVPFIKPSVPFGNLENPLFTRKGFVGILNDAYKEFKSKGEKLGGIFALHKPILIPIDPYLIKNILAKDFQHFVNRGGLFEAKSEPLTKNLLNLEDDKWKDIRAKLTPTFTSGKMKMMFEGMINSGDQMVEHMKGLTLEKKPMDLKEIISCFITDVIGTCVFGLDCNSFKNPDAEFRKYGRKAADLSAVNVFRLSMHTLVPGLAEALRLRVFDKDVTDFFSNAFKDVLDHRKATDSQRNDFVQLLLEIGEGHGNGSTLTQQEMITHAFSFFLAGSETSSSTLSYALYQLAMHQDIQDKVREEVLETVNRHDGQLTYEGLTEMKYMDQVFDETLRLYPSLPFLKRNCGAEYNIPEISIKIEKDTTVMICVLGLHLDEEYYPDSQKFDPERFTKENVAKRPPYTYLPFGDGPRVCIGRRFGLLQVKVGLSLILKNFKMIPNETTPKSLKANTKMFFVTFPSGLYLNTNFV